MKITKKTVKMKRGKKRKSRSREKSHLKFSLDEVFEDHSMNGTQTSELRPYGVSLSFRIQLNNL